MQTPDTPTSQVDYWDRVADSVTFTHPVDAVALVEELGIGATVVDYGCGYGRTCTVLAEAGLSPIGLDTSAEMIHRGQQLYPQLDLRTMPAGHAPLPDGSVDAVLLFAVLTCIADDASQDAVMADVRRILRPDGVLYLSDYGLQDDARNQERYARWAPELGTYGCFEIEPGVVMRHHSEERWAQLLEGMTAYYQERLTIKTFRGNPVVITQIRARVNSV